MVSDRGLISVSSPFGKKSTCDPDSVGLCVIDLPCSNDEVPREHEKRKPSVLRRTFKAIARFLLSCIPTAIPIVIVMVLFVLGKSYVKQCVMWLDDQETWLVCLMFCVLYTAVSFPVVWGYIVLNLACGYHFGLISGVAVTVVGACIGLSLAHMMMSLCSECLRKHLFKLNIVNSMVQVMKGNYAFRVVVASRLSPIPFGLQNAVFAISGVRLAVYVLASVVGLLPTQIINAYLGTTLRSMEDVLMDDRTAMTGYVVLIIQVICSVLLMTFIVRSAKKELEKSGANSNQPVSSEETSCGDEEDDQPLVKSPSSILFSPEQNRVRVAIT